MTAANGKVEYSGRDLVPRITGPSHRWERLDAFHPPYRQVIKQLAGYSRQLEDLVETFPALLFALASGYATPPRRERAFALVCAGAPLREAADALGLPWWLRRVPPQGLAAPLPPLPADPDFSLRIANLIPREARLTSSWLARVSHAHQACSAEYALWLARQPDLSALPDEHFMLLAAWAWFSGQSGLPSGLLGTRLLRRPWSPEMSFKRAREEMALWRQRLRLIEWLGSGIETPWLADGTAAGFSFVALRTVDDFVGESQSLDNCLDQYADQLHTGRTAVFSIRRGTRSVACVEIGLHETEVTMPTIVQLRAARNRRAPPEVWQAAYAWLGSQRLSPLAPARHAPKRAQQAEARQALWRPYLAHLAGTPHEEPFRRLVSERGPWPAGERRRQRPEGDLRVRLRAVIEEIRSEGSESPRLR